MYLHVAPWQNTHPNLFRVSNNTSTFYESSRNVGYWRSDVPYFWITDFRSTIPAKKKPHYWNVWIWRTGSHVRQFTAWGVEQYNKQIWRRSRWNKLLQHVTLHRLDSALLRHDLICSVICIACSMGFKTVVRVPLLVGQPLFTRTQPK